jgi:hypothetical protein
MFRSFCVCVEQVFDERLYDIYHVRHAASRDTVEQVFESAALRS